MNANDIGPLQLLVVGFGPDAEFEGLVLDELERLTARGLIRVVDLRFVTKDSEGSIEAIELTDLGSDEATEYGSVIDALIGLRARPSGDLAGSDDTEEQSFGLGPDELEALARDLRPGEAVGLLLFEHTWATELKAAIRATGGFPIAQGLLTPEALLMVGAEVQAIAEAEAAIELADAISGAAMLDAIAVVAAAEDIKTAAAIEAVQALIVAGLIADAAAEDALEALLAAELIEEAAIEAATEEAARAIRETDQALGALAAAESGAT
ncbi:MAG: hypothetical protein OEV40_06380 [Acidimicrobiia bacterium]|nr:hypothetical protein [Acidimicrobiia bacterium]